MWWERVVAVGGKYLRGSDCPKMNAIVERCTCLEGSSRLGLIGDSLEGYIAAAGFIDNSSSLLPIIDLIPIISEGLIKIIMILQVN